MRLDDARRDARQMTCVGRKQDKGTRSSKSQTVRGSVEQAVNMYIPKFGDRMSSIIMGKHLDGHLIHIKLAPQTKPHQEALHFPCPVSFLPS